ncbi:MAG: hypothetical protein Fur002_26280 [Anaerolineales bacterium]
MQKRFALFISAPFLLFLLFLGNLQYVRAFPGGTDFLYRWLPTRLVVFEGNQNPYSPEAELQVELAHHGHPREKDETPGIFAYPYYTMAVIFPFALISDFNAARAAWMTLLAASHLALIFLTLRVIQFKPAVLLTTALILFSLLNADFMQALIDGNPSSVAALFAFLALYFMSRKQDGWAGVFLALSTIKPQLVVLFFALVYLWAFFQKRWTLIFSSALTLAFLFGVSFILQPNWIFEFIKDLKTYPGVARPSTPRAILSYWMPALSAQIIALALMTFSALALFYVWRRSLRREFSALLWAACITFTLMPLTGITSAKSNYIAMLPGLIFLLQRAKLTRPQESLWAGALLVWIPLSWLFLVAGRALTLGGRLIYFLDFYPMPLVLTAAYLWFTFSQPSPAYASPLRKRDGRG